MLISVVICTYNRVHYLSDAIQSVCDQVFPQQDFEILVVDNASTDDTPQVVRAFCESYTFVRYLVEPKVGLSHARNRGWQEARGEYIAYLDDDAKASSRWLASAYRVIKHHSPALLGGPYKAFFKVAKPDWFKESYGSRSLGDTPMQLDKGFLSGGNLFVRRDVFTRIGGFDPELGMSGDKIAYAEEVFFQRRLREKFPDEIIYYDPDILIFHLVRPEKYRLRWRLASSFANGRDSYWSHPDNNLAFSTVLLSTVGLFFKLLAVGAMFLFRDRKQYPFWQNYVYEQVHFSFGKAGKVFASWFCLFSMDREKKKHAHLS